MASFAHGAPRQGPTSPTQPQHQLHHANYHPSEANFIHHQLKRLKDESGKTQNAPPIPQTRGSGRGSFSPQQPQYPGFQEWIPPSLGSSGPRRAMTSAYPVEGQNAKDHVTTKNGWFSDSEVTWSPTKRRSAGRLSSGMQVGPPTSGGDVSIQQSHPPGSASRMRETFISRQQPHLLVASLVRENPDFQAGNDEQSKSEPSTPITSEQQKRKKKRPKRRPNEKRKEKSRRWIEGKKLEKESRRLETERQLEVLLADEEEDDDEDTDNDPVILPQVITSGSMVVAAEDDGFPVLRSAPLPVQRELPAPDPEQEALFASTAFSDTMPDRVFPLRRASTLPIRGTQLQSTVNRPSHIKERGLFHDLRNPRNQSESPDRNRAFVNQPAGHLPIRYDNDGYVIPGPQRSYVSRIDVTSHPSPGLTQIDVRDFATDHNPTTRGGYNPMPGVAGPWPRSQPIHPLSPRSGWAPSTAAPPSVASLSSTSTPTSTIKSISTATITTTTMTTSSTPTTSPPCSPSPTGDTARQLFLRDALPNIAMAPLPIRYPRPTKTEPAVGSDLFIDVQPATAYNPISNTVWTLSSEEEVQLAQEQSQTRKAPTWPAPRPVGKQGGMRGEGFP